MRKDILNLNEAFVAQWYACGLVNEIIVDLNSTGEIFNLFLFLLIDEERRWVQSLKKNMCKIKRKADN